MIPKHLYRLNEYRISEFADGSLGWDAHSSFGTQIGGPCFVYGNILLIGAQSSEENGFLKLEFIGTLKRLPMWHRTRYYCFASALLDVSSGRNISKERLQQMVSLSNMTSTGSKTMIGDNPGVFRLGQYQITIAPDCVISWKSHDGTHQIIGGPAVLESDILFIGPRKFDDPQQNKREFLHFLRALPQWDRTAFWCRSLALKPVLTDAKRLLTPSFQKKERISPKKRTPVKSHRSKYAKQAWSQLTDYCSDWVEEVKAGWPKRVWPKKKKQPKKKLIERFNAAERVD
ncbi:hypothetical protein [Desulfosarcina alkanivorans]|uniref:hypothetical protein n=1 Tax=Desulfosarcina alkanivorans TaxID=571177 RepID=UPI0012D33AE7|nr:hypothetical protein [Desulfosarcina alkanivorans]